MGEQKWRTLTLQARRTFHRYPALLLALLVLCSTACSSAGDDTASGSRGDDVVVTEPTTTTVVAPTATALPSTPGAVAEDQRSNEPSFDTPDQRPTSGPDLPAINSDWPEIGGGQALRPVADLRNVNPLTEPSAALQVTAADGLHPDIVFPPTYSPDGQHVWVAIENTGAAGCDGRSASQLGIAAQDGSIRLVAPVDVLPDNVRSVHLGPNAAVLLEHGCEGEVSWSVATTEGDGTLANIRPVAGATPVHRSLAPHWFWKQHPEEGGLHLEVPHLRSADGPEIWTLIDWNAGAAIDAWIPETPTTELPLLEAYDQEWADRIDLAPAGLALTQTIAVSGDRGVVLLPGFSRRRGHSDDYPNPITVPDDPVNATAWSPDGSALAWTTATSLRVHSVLHNQQNTIGTADSPGDARVAFSPDGAQLAWSRPGELGLYTLAPVDPDALDAPKRLLPVDAALSSEGLGSLRIGMLASEVESLLGHEVEIFTLDGQLKPGYCAYLESLDIAGVWALAEVVETDSGIDAVVRRISVTGGPWQTPSGLRIGSDHDAVGATLGQDRIEVSPHVYVTGSYLRYLPTDPDAVNSVQFDTNNNQVTQIHVGDRRWIGAIEGCA